MTVRGQASGSSTTPDARKTREMLDGLATASAKSCEVDQNDPHDVQKKKGNR
jgi:hypothetical protein